MATDTLMHPPATAPEHGRTADQKARGPISGVAVRSAKRIACVALVLEAWARLVVFDALSLIGYKRVSAFTRSRRVARTRSPFGTTERVCRSIDEACVWYVKRVHCLQRSTVTTWMLRDRGIRAELVIGYRPVPVDSHAWVEVDGAVVNDRPQYQKFYQVLERC